LELQAIQTAAALRVDDDYCAPDVVLAVGPLIPFTWNDTESMIQGLDNAADVNSAQENTQAEILDSLWDDRPKVVDGLALCKAHGKACSRGICKEYADQLKLEKQKRDEIARAKAKNRNRRRGGAGKI
jgi:hypothetical protein